MKIKKYLSLFLALAMLFALCACGADTSGDEQNNNVRTPETAPVESEPVASDPVSTPAPDSPLSSGTVSGSKYVNNYFGIVCQLPSGWSFMSREQLSELYGYTVEQLSDDDLKAALESGSSYIDMLAMSPDSLRNVNATIEKLSAVQGVVIDEEGYADAALGSGSLQASYSQMGASNIVCEKNSVSIMGESHVGIFIQADINGTTLIQQMAIIKLGSYVLVLTFTCNGPDTTSEMINFFSKA